MGSTPLVVSHPCALVRDTLHRILTKSQFQPVHVRSTLEGTEDYLSSAGICIWLFGVRECGSTTNELVRRVIAANPSVRPVVLATSHTPKDVMLALEAGAFGFLWQNIPSNQLIKSLELVVLGQIVIHPQSRLTTFAPMAVQSPPAAIPASPAIEKSVTWQEAAAGEVIKGLSRRELVILRTLTDVASNRIIALKLVITESTVKVHMKAILRKLRVQNRTQAAIWARAHLGELTSSYAALTAL